MLFRHINGNGHGFHVQYSKASIERMPAAADHRTYARGRCILSNNHVRAPKIPTAAINNAHVASSAIVVAPSLLRGALLVQPLLAVMLPLFHGPPVW
tara:strand:+ start:113 stop:403 length:291 start_codon:yes stop_codon:yes gene_type:complete